MSAIWLRPFIVKICSCISVKCRTKIIDCRLAFQSTMKICRIKIIVPGFMKRYVKCEIKITVPGIMKISCKFFEFDYKQGPRTWLVSPNQLFPPSPFELGTKQICRVSTSDFLNILITGQRCKTIIFLIEHAWILKNNDLAGTWPVIK